MIIGTESRIHRVDAFVEGLQQAARGIFLVTAQPGQGQARTALSTGWLITESLIVVPSYALEGHLQYFCRLGEDEPEVELEVIDTATLTQSAVARSRDAVVLRLAHPVNDRAQRLAGASVKADESMFILHHAQGDGALNISAGRFLAVTTDAFQYDADTLPGSGGGPIFSSRDWNVVGMHMLSRQSERQNEGVPIGRLLDALRSSTVWPEIAAFHRLADAAAAHSVVSAGTAHRTAPESDPDQSAKLRAALRWSFLPDEFGNREAMKRLVADPAAKSWSLKTHERQRALDAAPSLAVLQAARGVGGSQEPGQQVIDRILQGPPYDLSEIDEAALPYWLQAVRWFGKAIPQLPSTVSISQELARRRVRSQLREITGGAVRGREKELDALKGWFETSPASPMMVTGIGGVGKSTLVAQFALQRPKDVLLLWLDFDRADLAPDDAVSVLGMMSDQMSVQLAAFTRTEINEQNWEAQAKAIGDALETASARSPALLVLDGFEVAQHAARHSEIWRVLDAILERAPQLRVIVSGRAPVKSLVLRGVAAKSVNLTGIPLSEARTWLREKGIDDPAVNERVAAISKGVPLLLRLALCLFESGEPVLELPAKLPEVFIEGFLYQRILNRVMDQELKGLANDALVLRTLTPGLVEGVLHDRIPPGLDSRETFKRLSQEMGLVDPGGLVPQTLAINIGQAGRLQLRPEVRSATLRLLETDNADRVREIDRRAADWYGQQPLAEASNAAELIYHSLRLGDLARAEKAWLEECAGLLEHAADDLPEDARAAREWLRDKVAGASDHLATWELRTVAVVRDHLRRGLERGIPDALNARAERSAQSPLVFYDAWVRWRAHDLPGAREILENAAPAQGAVQRDRTLLRAVIAVGEGRREEADRLLMEIQSEDQWQDRPGGARDALAVLAARVRLTVDLEAELALLMPGWRPGETQPDTARFWRERTSGYVLPSDLVLAEFFISGQTGKTESFSGIPVPVGTADLQIFQNHLDLFRIGEAQSFGTFSFVSLNVQWEDADRLPPQSPTAADALELRALKLAILGWRRWKLASTTPFLRQASDLLSGNARDSFVLAIVASLMPFRSIPLNFHPQIQVDNLLAGAAETFISVPTLPPSAALAALVRKWLQAFGDSPALGNTHFSVSADTIRSFLDQVEKDDGLEQPWVDMAFRGLEMGYWPSVQTSLLLYALSPEPLELLCQRAACPPGDDPSS